VTSALACWLLWLLVRPGPARRPSRGVPKFYGWLRLMNSTAAYGGGSGAYPGADHFPGPSTSLPFSPPPVWELPGGWGGGRSTPVNVFNPPSCASLHVLGVRNNPHRSQLQTLMCPHIPQVIEPCHCCQAYVHYPQSADANCSCSAFSGRIKHSTHMRRVPAVKTEPLQ